MTTISKLRRLAVAGALPAPEDPYELALRRELDDAGVGVAVRDEELVRRQETAGDGEIVVALVGEEATVKRFFREPDHIRLQPENAAMEPIRSRDVRVLGRVVGLFRSVQ